MIAHGPLDPRPLLSRAQALLVPQGRQLVDPAPETPLFGGVGPQSRFEASTPRSSVSLTVRVTTALFGHLYRKVTKFAPFTSTKLSIIKILILKTASRTEPANPCGNFLGIYYDR
jgi:hypothetical protein